ncbi:glycosyltransferase [Methanobrevibacter sp.]|uniref:glycosyltransferase n=1 Tax=Methanobrevibacter sp. TaxID=66852 RepID=UPI0025CDD213|nr:glycosyltransferase [Methanobrevibacter sp.]MBQ2961921.1 glycosyltransferase [Methanobrevibacter sp.]
MVKISVIVPVFNCEDYIEESIGGILNQTFNDIEIICVDDGSTDSSLGMLNRMAAEDSRLKVYSQENQGSSIARNNALSKAGGDYVYFFDADDYIAEDCLEKIYCNAIANDSDIAIFYFDIYENDSFLRHCSIDLDKKFPYVDHNNFTFNYRDYMQFAFKGSSAPWFKLYKKEFLDEHDFIKFPINLNHNDVPFHIMTILNASKISFLPEYLYHYRLDNPNSISNNRQKRYDDIFSIIQIVEDYLRAEGLFDDLKKEFDFLKVNHITYQISGRPDEYFDLAKEELSAMDLSNDYLTKNMLFKANTILYSNSMEEYNYKIEINKLGKENDKLSKDNKQIKKQNKDLKSQIKKLQKQYDEILDSNSWKMTEIFRKIRHCIR